MADDRRRRLHNDGWRGIYGTAVRRGDTAQAVHYLYRARVQDDQPLRGAARGLDYGLSGRWRAEVPLDGRAYPDHGSWAFTVVASAPVSGDFTFPVFTRMKFVNHVPDRGMVHNTLALAYLIGDALGWGELSWMENPESGAVLVRAPAPGGD